MEQDHFHPLNIQILTPPPTSRTKTMKISESTYQITISSPDTIYIDEDGLRFQIRCHKNNKGAVDEYFIYKEYVSFSESQSDKKIKSHEM